MDGNTNSHSPSLADRLFIEAMSPALREGPYSYYERFRGPAPLLRVTIELAGTPTRPPTFTLRGLETLPVTL